MNKIVLYIFILFLIACTNNKELKKYYINDFMTNNDTLAFNIKDSITEEKLFSHFDSIPVDFGYRIFNDLIKPISSDTSVFKAMWNWKIDTITCVFVKKNNVVFDVQQNVSSNTYYFLICFITSDSIDITSTLYADLENNELGTFVLNHNNNNQYITGINIKKEYSVEIPELKKKLFIYHN